MPGPCMRLPPCFFQLPAFDIPSSLCFFNTHLLPPPVCFSVPPPSLLDACHGIAQKLLPQECDLLFKISWLILFSQSRKKEHIPRELKNRGHVSRSPVATGTLLDKSNLFRIWLSVLVNPNECRNPKCPGREATSKGLRGSLVESII